MNRRLCALLAAIGLLLLTATGTFAAPVETTTTVVKEGVETFDDVLFCADNQEKAPATITITYHLVEHVTRRPDGAAHFTFTQTGTFLAAITGTDLVYTGRYTQRSSFNANQRATNAIFVFSITGKGSDGSRVTYQFVEHFTEGPNGLVVEFEKGGCHRA